MNARDEAHPTNKRGKTSPYPLLAGPLAVAASVAASAAWPERFQDLQVWLEKPAPYLVALATAIYAARAARTRNPLHVLLAVLGAALTCREIHFAGTGTGVYVALAALAAWAVLWRKRLREPLRDYRHVAWVLAAAAAYILSQVIARRAFRFIPGEHAIHRSLEECAETAAHAVFIVSALVGSWRRPARGKAP